MTLLGAVQRLDYKGKNENRKDHYKGMMVEKPGIELAMMENNGWV